MSKPEASDTQFTEELIDKVEREGDGWVVSHGGWSLWLTDAENESGVVPKVGDWLRMYGEGLGRPVRGVLINGSVVRYKTEAEYEREWQEKVDARRREQREKAEAARPDTDRRVAALPEVLRARIEKFRSTNPDFWWEFESYELFCCEQAVILADHFRGHGGVDALVAWNKKPYNEQQDIVKLDEGHSGNTFGMTVRLAYDLLNDPARAAKEHGALTPLVGCEEYGCPHPRKDAA